MKAGRELDALIAEKVMGHSVFNTGKEGRPSHGAPHSAVIFGKNRLAMCVLHEDGEGATTMIVPHYSTRIADAWLVVEKFEMFRLNNVYDGFQCKVMGYDADGEWIEAWYEKADTAPLAICLAALKAVE